MADDTHDTQKMKKASGDKQDRVTPLAKMNDNPPDPKKAKESSGEKEDNVTPLAKMNDNPPRESSEE